MTHIKGNCSSCRRNNVAENRVNCAILHGLRRASARSGIGTLTVFECPSYIPVRPLKPRDK